jgi:signal transduction histidine kinase
LDGVAHELNNPLFVISGYAQLAIEKVDRGRSDGLTKDLEAVLEATQRATDVIKRFMGLARSAPGRYEPCEVTSVVQRTLELMANDLTIHDIEVRTAFQPDLPPLLADPQELTQVFLNLVTNAKQAMAPHGRGTLTVTTALVRTRHGPGVEVRVADNGPGISPENLSRVFDPFFTTSPVGGGTGLGLTITHRIVTGLGGTLTCESRPGQGATFIARLPAQSAESLSQAQEAEPKET